MPALTTQTLDLLREDGHRSGVFFSFLKPLTLWSMRVNNAGVARGDIVIDFDSGSGLDVSAVEDYQELWVGTSAGDDDVGRVRIKGGITSGDGGVTGTIGVAANVIWWEDDHYLTVKHNYPMVAMYPYIDGGDPDVIGDEVFYKDRDIEFNDNQNGTPNPAVVVDFSQRAGFIRDGELVFWVDASNSYAIANGASISSYAMSVYPATGVTTSFDTGTGIGRIEVTSLTQEYYWVKFTVTDSNGKTQDSWRCIFAHDPDPTGSTYPHTFFNVNQLAGGYDRGGWYAQALIYQDSSLDDIPDRAFSVLWAESLWGKDQTPVSLWRNGNYLLVNPRVEYAARPGASNYDVTLTLKAGVMVDGVPAADGTNIEVEFCIGVNCQNNSNTTTDGQVEITQTLTNVASSGTAILSDSTGTIEIVTVDYEPGLITSVENTYPHTMVAFPRSLIVGYTRKDQLSSSETSAQGTQRNTIEITTVEDLLRNEYMFSISLAARAIPTEWYEYASWLTIGRAVHHVWKWHSTLMETADVVGLVDNTDGRAFAEFEDGTLYTMPDTMARQQGIRAHVVCNKDGQVHLTQDVQLLTDSERAALDTVATITTTDRSGEMVLTRIAERRVAIVFTSGFSFDGTFTYNDDTEQDEPNAEPYCAISPGSFPPHGGGEGTVNLDRQVFQDQNHANQIAGRVDATHNNKYPELRIKFHGDYLDVIDFHLAEFWEIDLSTSSTLREIALPDLKLIPRDCSVQVDVASGAITCNVVFEPEAQGNTGITSECPGLTDLGNFDIPIPDESTLPGAIVDAGSVHYLPPDSSTWVLRTAEVTLGMCQDPFWRTRQNSFASADAIMLRCGTGYIKRTTDAWL